MPGGLSSRAGIGMRDARPADDEALETPKELIDKGGRLC
jgi:hypothetical protein